MTNPYGQGGLDDLVEQRRDYITDERTSGWFTDQSGRLEEVTRERFGSGDGYNEVGPESSGGESAPTA